MRVIKYISLALRYRKNPFFIKYLSGRRVLDVGAGQGCFVAKDPKNFVGVELDKNLVESCCNKGLEVYCMNALALNFPDSTFDAVHAAQMIEHFSPNDAVQFLREAARVVRPGGIIFITTPGIRNVWNTFSHIRPYPPVSFSKLLTRATEGYLQEGVIPLKLEAYFGNRYHFNNLVFTFIIRAIDIILPPKNPHGWTIILKKI